MPQAASVIFTAITCKGVTVHMIVENINEIWSGNSVVGPKKLGKIIHQVLNQALLLGMCGGVEVWRCGLEIGVRTWCDEDSHVTSYMFSKYLNALKGTCLMYKCQWLKSHLRIKTARRHKVPIDSPSKPGENKWRSMPMSHPRPAGTPPRADLILKRSAQWSNWNDSTSDILAHPCLKLSHWAAWYPCLKN